MRATWELLHKGFVKEAEIRIPIYLRDTVVSGPICTDLVQNMKLTCFPHDYFNCPLEVVTGK